MPLSFTDLLTFALFLGAVIFVSLRAAGGRKTAEGWVERRGSRFWSEWDPACTALFVGGSRLLSGAFG